MTIYRFVFSNNTSWRLVILTLEFLYLRDDLHFQLFIRNPQQLFTCWEMISAASVGSWHWLMTSQISWSLNRKLMPSVVKARKESLACWTCRNRSWIYKLIVQRRNEPNNSKPGKSDFHNCTDPNRFETKTSDEAGLGLTERRCVSGSAMTPLDFRWKSPMLRVMASRPLTFAWPTLFHDRKPPNSWILNTKTKQDQLFSTRLDQVLEYLTLWMCVTLVPLIWGWGPIGEPRYPSLLGLQ